ncbi:MAG: OmpA family protein [Elusimicrobiota bacterium]|nr:OmpA family protein [Elusimicrobiota bacterium]
MTNRALLLVLVASLAGCVSSNRKPKSADKGGKAGSSSSSAEAAPMAPGADVQEASLKVDGVQFDSDPELKTVKFEYDSAQLSDETLAVLKENAATLKRRKDAVALVAGHTDERGTVAYNLALGQKRAKEVRDYYIRLGVDGRRLATISYGKEMPVCSTPDEDCWQKNRRAETRVRAKSGGTGPAASEPEQ